ncbi:MAG: AraC-like DNA-binding protein [Bermanella sp.]|jgi:AraC-like DNA-binding protein
MTQLVRSESLTGYCELVAELGGESEQLLQPYNLDAAKLNTEGYMFPYRNFVGLLEASAKALKCPDFGIRCANKQDFSVLGPIALAAQQSQNLGQALQRVSSYLHVYTPALGLNVSLLPGGNALLIAVEILLKPLPKCTQAVELTMALSAKIIHMLSGGQATPLKVLLPHSPINSSAVYRKAFPCEVLFNQGVCGYEVNAADVNLPLSSEQTELGAMAYSYLESHFLARQSSLSERVQALIKPLLMAEQCTNETVAKALEMDVRQLHRALETEGTNFRAIKDSVLKELAELYLNEKALKLGQISRLLGYSEQSGFSRSCQRWFGMGPRDYRNRLE